MKCFFRYLPRLFEWLNEKSKSGHGNGKFTLENI